jgi:hypothetical protein
MDTSFYDEVDDVECLMISRTLVCFDEEQNAFPRRRCLTRGCVCWSIVKILRVMLCYARLFQAQPSNLWPEQVFADPSKCQGMCSLVLW